MRRILQIIGIKPGERKLKIMVDDGGQKVQDEKEIISQINKAKEANLIAAALIATVTFAAGFTLPRVYMSKEGPLQGKAILAEKLAFQVFVIMNTIAMVLSACTIFIHLFWTMERKTSRIIGYFQTASYFTTLSMGAMAAAFITGIFAVLAHSTTLTAAIFIIGMSFFVLCFIIFNKSYLTSKAS